MSDTRNEERTLGIQKNMHTFHNALLGTQSAKVVKMVSLVILNAVLILQYICFGLRRAPDALAFEGFINEVYPLYSIILWIFRTLMGEGIGYWLLGLMQNILLALSIHSLVGYVQTRFRLSNIIAFLLMMGIMILFPLQKFVTYSGIVSSNTIMSEGISIPIYLFFFRYSLEAYLDRNSAAFWQSCLYVTLLILTRGQLYWCIVVVFIVGIRLKTLYKWKTVAKTSLVCLAIIACVQGARYIQTMRRDPNQPQNPASIILLSTTVYCSNSDDYLLFEEGAGEQALFMAVRNEMDNPDKLIGYTYETGNLIDRHGKFEAEYDGLKEKIKAEYRKLISQGETISIGQMTVELAKENWAAFLMHCIQNSVVALIRTVAILHPVLVYYGIAFFVIGMFLVIAFRKKPEIASARMFATLGILCSILNALMMAPGVFALSRYVFYNMPIMYLAAFVYVREIITTWREGHLCTASPSRAERKK